MLILDVPFFFRCFLPALPILCDPPNAIMYLIGLHLARVQKGNGVLVLLSNKTFPMHVHANLWIQSFLDGSSMGIGTQWSPRENAHATTKAQRCVGHRSALREPMQCLASVIAAHTKNL